MTPTGSLIHVPERLLIYQALWAMDQLDKPEAGLCEKFDRVKAAGFDGMAIDLGALSFAEARQTIPEFARTGLRSGLTAFPQSVEDLRPALQLAHEIRAPFVVVIGQQMPLELGAMIQTIRAWLAVAKEENMPIQFETHRNCITNDLYTTVQLLEAVPEMRISADFSHYVVGREMPCPVTPWLQQLMTLVMHRADSFQGRIASRSQIQIPLHFSQSQKWIEVFRQWWLEGFSIWRARHRQEEASLVFICELGPPDYAITDEDGAELSDRWDEALTLARWARELWINSHRQ
jgi:hypothetical protein